MGQAGVMRITILTGASPPSLALFSHAPSAVVSVLLIILLCPLNKVLDLILKRWERGLQTWFGQVADVSWVQQRKLLLLQLQREHLLQ
jgi:hypothetical protein